MRITKASCAVTINVVANFHCVGIGVTYISLLVTIMFCGYRGHLTGFPCRSFSVNFCHAAGNSSRYSCVRGVCQALPAHGCGVCVCGGGDYL
jgi:hypothetical protein